MRESSETGSSLEKEQEDIKQRLKEVLFEGFEAPSDLESKITEMRGEMEEDYPIDAEEWNEVIDEKNYREGIEMFIDRTMDTSWVDKDVVAVLEKSKDKLGLSIPETVNFLRNLRELKKEKK